MRKYIEIFKYSLKTEFAFIYNYLFSMFSFTVHVFVFNELWDYILKGKDVAGYNKSELIWYIIIAECIVYSVNRNSKKISDMVKQGDVANMLIKPVDIINYFFSEAMSSIVKLGINIIFAIILGFTLAGTIKFSIENIVFGLISIILGVIIGNLLQVFLGILAFFTEEINSFWLIIQKITFFVVFTPLEFYPTFVQKILLFLPSTYEVYGTAKIITNYDLNLALKLLFMQIISIGVLYGIIRLMFKKGAEKINVNGG